MTTRYVRHIESKTGGNFGLLVIRPPIKCEINKTPRNRAFRNDDNLIARLCKDYCCGLLCQAKFKGYSIQKRCNSFLETT